MISGAPLTPRTPWPELAALSNGRGGVSVKALDGLGLATVIVRRGQLAALTERVRDRFGIVLPQGAYRSEAAGVAFAGTGPEVWLASRETLGTRETPGRRETPGTRETGNGFAGFLANEIGAAAAVSDQSDGYAVLRLTGPKVRGTLAKMLPVDLHARAFKVGDVASTVAAHMGATLWRLEDAPDGAAVFDIAVFRSFAGDFWHALSESAAEFGLVETAPDA
jgi:sarcosine oxidase subunit gamma